LPENKDIERDTLKRSLGAQRSLTKNLFLLAAIFCSHLFKETAVINFFKDTVVDQVLYFDVADFRILGFQQALQDAHAFEGDVGLAAFFQAHERCDVLVGAFGGSAIGHSELLGERLQHDGFVSRVAGVEHAFDQRHHDTLQSLGILLQVGPLDQNRHTDRGQSGLFAAT